MFRRRLDLITLCFFFFFILVSIILLTTDNDMDGSMIYFSKGGFIFLALLDGRLQSMTCRNTIDIISYHLPR